MIPEVGAAIEADVARVVATIVRDRRCRECGVSPKALRQILGRTVGARYMAAAERGESISSTICTVAERLLAEQGWSSTTIGGGRSHAIIDPRVYRDSAFPPNPANADYLEGIVGIKSG